MITPSLLLPSNAFWLYALKNEKWSIITFDNFQKKGFRNRFEYADGQGRKLFTVPVKGGKSHHQSMVQVVKSDPNAINKSFYQTLKTVYGSAPYFIHFAPVVIKIFNENSSIINLNKALMDWCIKAGNLNITVHYIDTQQNDTSIAKIEEDLKKIMQTPINWIAHYQRFSEKNGFISNLSILDTLMHLGPRTGQYLNQHTALLPFTLE